MSLGRAGGSAILAIGLLACGLALPHPEPTDVPVAVARWGEGATLAELEQGRASYVARCSGCHQLILPSAYGPDRWPDLVAGMAERARLRPEQRRAVERYLVIAAARSR